MGHSNLSLWMNIIKSAVSIIKMEELDLYIRKVLASEHATRIYSDVHYHKI